MDEKWKGSGPFYSIKQNKQLIFISMEWMIPWIHHSKHDHSLTYLFNALTAMPMFDFIDLTEAPGSFLDACSNSESSSSNALQGINPLVGRKQ